MKQKIFEEWHKDYCNNQVIDLKKYLNISDFELLKKLDISVKNKVYTLLEYDILKQKLFEYYTDEEQEEDIKNGADIIVKSLEEKNVEQKDFIKLLNKIMKIYSF